MPNRPGRSPDGNLATNRKNPFGLYMRFRTDSQTALTDPNKHETL